jgi:hypothetical protein
MFVVMCEMKDFSSLSSDTQGEQINYVFFLKVDVNDEHTMESISKVLDTPADKI